MKKNLMAVLTASSVAVMAAGATLAAYAEPEQEPQIKDEDETYAYGVDSHCLYINTLEGFEKWKTAGIDPNEIKTISFFGFYDENGSEIPAGAFEGFTSVEKVIFQNTISKIGDNAFKGCTSLVEVVFQHESWGSLMTIGKSAFEGCTSISHLDFERTTVEKIGESAFKGCTSVSALQFTYYSSVTEIGKSAFQGCTGLMDVVFGPALKEIGESAFEGCTNLGKVEEIPNEETNNCDTEIVRHRVLFNSNHCLETIGDRAFYGCEKLTEIYFPDSLKTIGEYAFSNCATLYAVSMENCGKLESIKKYAFFNCLSLMEVRFPLCNHGCRNGNSFYYFDNNYYGYNPSAPKHRIEEGAFRNCSWLEGVILSPYVGYVAPGAFYKCKSLGYIGYYVDECADVCTNVKIEVDTNHSTLAEVTPPQIDEPAVDKQSLSLLAEPSKGEDSETVTIYVPPEVTVFSFERMTPYERKDSLNDKAKELLEKKLEEKGIVLDYSGQIIAENPAAKEEPIEPTREAYWYKSSIFGNVSYRCYYNNNNIPLDEKKFEFVHNLWEKEHSHWEKECEDLDAYNEWQAFLSQNDDIKSLWDEVLQSDDYRIFQSKSYLIKLLNKPKSEKIVLPEKFYHDVDIHSIKSVDGSVDIFDIPLLGKYSSYNYYDFSEIEARGYKFTANYLLGGTPYNHRTFRSLNDIENPKQSGLYGTNTGLTVIVVPIINFEKGEKGSFDTIELSSSSDTTTSPEEVTPPVESSNPPSPPPPSNTYDPIEPDPESSEPESSEPESSEPKSSESESNDLEFGQLDFNKFESGELESSNPESSKPESSEPEDNPPTGTRFLAPIVLVGAAVVVVAARRRKMK